MHSWIVIPAYNESVAVGGVITTLKDAGFDYILVVDDGSDDTTAEICIAAGARVVRHMINRGVGAATVTGMMVAFAEGADAVVTFDADGQHNVTDIANIIRPIADKDADVVLGYRKGFAHMPLLRKIANIVGNIVTWLVSGIWVRDSQSGLRAYSRKSFETMDLHANGYEFCSEVIRELHHHNLSFKQVPITVKYTEHSLSKGQSFDVGIGTLMKLVVRSLMR